MFNTKEEGELGIKYLSYFNMTLLGEWMWRMLVKSNNLI